MSAIKPDWSSLPCTRCIRAKGKSPQTANRRASNYYCRECNAEYQRDRYAARTQLSVLKPADLNTLLEEFGNLKALVNGPPFWEDEDLMAEFGSTMLFLETALNSVRSVVEQRSAEVRPGRPRKVVDWEGDSDLLDLRSMIAERERQGGKGLGSVIAHFQKRLRAKGYAGPELDYGSE